MIKASVSTRKLIFKRPGGTSRGVMTEKDSWFFVLEREDGGIVYGECSMLRGLNSDDRPGYEKKVFEVASDFEIFAKQPELLADWPSIRFGVEMAFRDYLAETPQILFPSSFTRGVANQKINGLVWMGEPSFMQEQIEEKLEAGFDCIKLKIGAIDFEEELRLLAYIRRYFGVDKIEIRVDANGAFKPKDALAKLNRLAEFEIHSIEQPIKQGQWNEMAELCVQTPVDIALDEELIGINDLATKQQVLDTIHPQYIILKPSLTGGFAASDEWINMATQRGVGWWATSALESNIGLNAIAQWTATKNNTMPQGLGTGSLFTNNFDSPLVVDRGEIKYDESLKWVIDL